MQKVQFYLSANRITAITDSIGSGFITENCKVYQRKLKLYKGIDNRIEIEVRNSDNRRVPMLGNTVTIKFFDALHRNLFTVSGTPILSKTGLFEVEVPADVIAAVEPQQLSMAAFLTNASNRETALYIDTQFSVLGSVELYDGYNEKFSVGDVIAEATVFNYDMGTKSYVSEVVEFGTRINDDYSTMPAATTVDYVQVDVVNNEFNAYEGEVWVEATEDVSLAIGNRWDVIQKIQMGPYDGSTRVMSSLVYKTVNGGISGTSRNYRYLRFRYMKPDQGVNARFKVTRENQQYAVEIVNGGSGYNINDQIRIPGSELDGTSVANDLTITVLAIDTNIDRNAAKSVSAISVEGVAVPGQGLYLSKTGKNLTGSLDKIVIRQ